MHESPSGSINWYNNNITLYLPNAVLGKSLFFKTRTPTQQYGVVDIIAVIYWFSHNVIKIQTRRLLNIPLRFKVMKY